MTAVRFNSKLGGLIRASRLYSDQVDSHTMFLSLLDADNQVAIPAEQYHVLARPVAGKRNHVRDDEWIHALLLPAVYPIS
jgi:hypothetical protein